MSADAPSVILRPAPGTLTGDRVVVRGLVDDDAEGMHEGIQESLDHLRPWMPWYDSHPTVTHSLSYIRRTQADFILRNSFQMGYFSADDGRFLGGMGLHCHDWDVPHFGIGYWVRRTEEGKGYVSEASKLLIASAFDDLHAQRLQLWCNARNERSAAVARRVGFVHEGTFRNRARDTDGNLETTLYFAMIRDDYERARRSW